MGFLAPIDSWLRGGLRPWAEELLDTDSLEDSGFRPEEIRRKWTEHLSGARNWQFALWPVLMWQSFFAGGGLRAGSATRRDARAGKQDAVGEASITR